ncbi:Uncharacterised protein [Weissella viridescens]|uniref:Uncharacterized protein n=1 Tax=Weissella viridescens TaxID=1629 RepID=A0A380P2A5_WEIVI|nr:Uncharacterised protein [Weissella viridescens]
MADAADDPMPRSWGIVDVIANKMAYLLRQNVVKDA